MKIAVHASHLSQEREDGNQTYIINLFKNLAKIDNKNEYNFYYSKESNKKIEAPNFHHIINTKPFAWTQRVFPQILKKDKPDLLFMPIQMLPFLKDKNQKSVVTIHDLAFLYYPETFPLKDRFLHKIYVKEAIHKADHLIAITEATKTDILKEYNVPESKISVVYHGVDKNKFRLMNDKDNPLIKEVLSKYNITKPYIIYVGNVQPRKNVQNLIRGFIELKKEYKEIQLVIAGASAWLIDEVMEEIKDLMNEDIIFTGRFQDKELVPLLWGAKLFVLPSLYEGFGLPILEAGACGLPTLVSNTPSLLEIVGDINLTFDPLNPEDIKEKILTVLKNKDLYDKIKEYCHQRSQEFSWEKTAKETLNILESI